ncbi:MAG: ribonucleoside-diphosphate reductase, adenosylcobalamin-dependent [Candidatus Doudnabacteria bacterium]|nr:ribonucleoside-diphosphate reductase, adenosylcobalamin-dependent [Candidatus Doudnabacteria bacterium]
MSENLQTRTTNALSDLGEKIFLDRYAVKDAKKETLTEGDTVVVCVNLKTGQREIGTVKSFDSNTKQVEVTLRDGSVETRSLEHVDKPLETVPEQMFDRIAQHISSVEKTPEKQNEWNGKFRELMDDWKYVPAGRIFTGAGTGQNLTFYNCYVIPCPEDSRGGIFDTLRQMAEIMSRGGGVGINVSTLRPRYAYVKGVNGRSSGSVSWASLYSFVTGLIEQGGSRRGALMLILNAWHPDILDFINAKREAGKITNANISVGITDDFMHAVKNDLAWDLVFPDTSDPLYKTEWANTQGDIRAWKKLGGKIIKHKTVMARDVWNQIISSAWSSAEPGMYFIDRANDMSNSHYYASLPCTNPCGEQPLPAWGVCNLGHVNLSKHLLGQDVDWNKLKETVQYAVRFQDNVIDATPYFFDENFKQQMSERRVGMGTIGLAEMLVRLGIRYGSEEGVKFIDKLYQFIAVTAYETSVELAREKGAFSQFDAEKFLESGFMKTMPEYIRSMVRQYGIRNVTIMTQAPTGTIGTMVGTSTGIEPFFSWSYFRKSRLGVHEEKIKLAQDWLDAHQGQDLPEYFATAMDLAPEDHVKVQAAVQRWTDSAISKTCNAPSNYTVEDTEKLYQLMYDLGCKGGTIYRDGSRDEQILATDKKSLGKEVAEQMQIDSDKNDALIAAAVVQSNSAANAEKTEEKSEDLLHVGNNKFIVKKLIQNGHKYEVVPRDRPTEMNGTTYKLNTTYGHLFVTINEDEHGPFEVFATLGKSGGFFAAQTEGLCRMISLGLRSGVSVDEIISQLKGIRSTEVSFNQGEIIYSLPDGVAKTLEKHINRKQQSLQLNFKETAPIENITEEVKIKVSEPVAAATGNTVPETRKMSVADFGHVPICQECGSMLRMAEGCMKCESCGFSKCG